MSKDPSHRSPQEPNGSRLDREIEEILRASERVQPLPKPPKPRPRQVRPSKDLSSLTAGFPRPLRHALKAPIIQALVLAIVAKFLDGVSPLLANILCVVAVLCILVPIIQQFRTPPPAPSSRMWRGRVVDLNPPSITTSPWDTIRRWLNRRR